MDLKVRIQICDELAESIVKSSGLLDLASGEIRGVQYEDYDPKTQGLPGQREDYEFTSGLLSNDGKDVEFRVEVDSFSGNYSITPSELLELKVRAAKLFAGIAPSTLVAAAPVSNPPAAPPAAAPAPPAAWPGGGAAGGADPRRKLH